MTGVGIVVCNEDFQRLRCGRYDEGWLCHGAGVAAQSEQDAFLAAASRFERLRHRPRSRARLMRRGRRSQFANSPLPQSAALLPFERHPVQALRMRLVGRGGIRRGVRVGVVRRAILRP
jgi:hypothetical protein